MNAWKKKKKVSDAKFADMTQSSLTKFADMA